MSFEPLEERRLLTVSATYYNDDWAMVADNAPAGLSIGDRVNNGHNGDGSIAADYGVDAFGRVRTDGQLAGSDMIADAIAATSSPGTTTVLHVPITGVGGNIELSDSDQVLSLGSTPQTVSLVNGIVLLSAGTLSVGINDSGTGKIATSNGIVELNGSSLHVFFGDTSASVGKKYVIIDNNSAAPIDGTFNDLPQGATFQAGERTLEISYVGGDGNDVELKVTAQLNPFTSFVNDNWHDPANGVLEVGDMVDDRNDHGGTPTIIRKFKQAAAVDGFQSAAYDVIQDAVDATAPGGAMTILPGSYSGNVVVAKPLVIQGDFTLDGSLTADDAPLTLITGTGIGTVEVTDLTLSSTSKLFMGGIDTDSDRIVVTGDVNLGDASLSWQWGGVATTNVILVDNQGNNPVTGEFVGLPEGTELLVNGQKFWITYVGGDGNDVELVIPDSSVAARNLFYEHSRYDGNTTGVSASDDGAIAPDKSALLPGVLADFTNVSSYSRGINGIMVDITGSHSNITADDLFFEVGIPENVPDVPNNPAPTSWITAPAPATVSVRSAAGTGGADRVEIIWADEVIQNEWLRVTVLSTMDTGLASPDVFYFGNRVGDSGLGNQQSRAITNSIDESGARLNPTPGGVWEPITNIYDYTRNGKVSAADESEARLNNGSLYYMTAPVIPPVGQLLGPSRWTPGTDITLSATAPILADGNLDSSILRIDFYQDVNGNGIFDQADELVAEGDPVLDEDDNVVGWNGTFDPGDLVIGASSVLAVPLNSSGPIGSARRIAPNGVGSAPIIATPAVNGGSSTNSWNPRVGFAINLGTVAINAAARATGNFNGGNLVYGVGIAVAGAAGSGLTRAFAASVGGFSATEGETSGVATSAGIGYTNIVGGPDAEILAQASTSAGATAVGPGATVAAAGDAGFGGFVSYTVVSASAPIGTPVMIVREVLAIGYAIGNAQTQLNGVAVGTLAVPNSNPLTVAISQAIPAVVGGVITVGYNAPAGFGNNQSFVGAASPPPNYPADSDYGAGLQFLKINLY